MKETKVKINKIPNETTPARRRRLARWVVGQLEADHLLAGEVEALMGKPVSDNDTTWEEL